MTLNRRLTKLERERRARVLDEPLVIRLADGRELEIHDPDGGGMTWPQILESISARRKRINEKRGESMTDKPEEPNREPWPDPDWWFTPAGIRAQNRDMLKSRPPVAVAKARPHAVSEICPPMREPHEED